MAILSADQLRATWINAGGNPQYADAAAKRALVVSGGNSEAPRGLWGVSSANTAPLDDARAAIAASNDGQGIDTIGEAIAAAFDPVGTVAGLPDSAKRWVADLFGVDDLWIVIRFAAVTIAGWALIFVGLAIMIFGSRPVRAAVTNVVGSAVGGVGFGVGANVTTRQPRENVQGVPGLPAGRGRGGPDGATGGGPVPTGPPPVPPDRFFSPPAQPRGTQTTVLSTTRELPKVSEANPVHAPMRRQRRQRIEQPIVESGRLFGPPRVAEGGRHRAGR